MRFTISTLEEEHITDYDDSATVDGVAKMIANQRCENVFVYDSINQQRVVVANRKLRKRERKGVHVRVHPDDAESVKIYAQQLNTRREVNGE